MYTSVNATSKFRERTARVGIRTYRPKFVQTIVERMCPMRPCSSLRDGDRARQFVRNA